MSKYTLVPSPASPAERLLARFRSRLSIPDPSPVYALMSAVVANLLEGPPVWLMLVGPPSCGKSELLNSLLDLPNVVEVADISGEAAFLSGSPKKDHSKDATGGLLRQVGPHGAMVINDFTSVLAKSGDTPRTIMAVFREVYGGRWTRHIGGEGGRSLHWTGKCAIFGGVTSVIDQHHQVSAELGERWIYFHFEESDEFQASWIAIQNGHENWRADLRSAVRDFLDELNLNFGRSVPHRTLSSSEVMRVHQLAQICTRCRSAVTRDGSYKHEVVGVCEREVSTRLSTIFAQLFLGMDRIGVPKPWQLLARVMMDSMPIMRKRAVHLVAHKASSVEQIQKVIGCSINTAKRVVEDLELHGVLEEANGVISLTKWMEEHNALNIYRGKFGA